MKIYARLPAFTSFLALFLAPPVGHSAPINLPFDAAYTVASAGSTEPVATFDLDGPAPWFYVDLPDGALYSFSVSTNSKWFHGSTTPQFTLADGYWGGQDKYWLSPTQAEWEAKRSTGTWRIDATHSLVDLVMIYGVGAPVVWGTGSTSVQFAVVDTLPGDFNNDGLVDSDDLAGVDGWQERYGNDLSGQDFLTWQRNYPATPELNVASLSVPEPGTVVLLGALGCLVLPRRTL